MSGKRRLEMSKGSEDGVADSMAPAKEVYSGAGSNVVKEAEEKKRGGKVHRKNGGKVSHMIEGHAAKRRMDRPGRKMGGACGSDKNPLSSAAHPSKPAGRSLLPDEAG